MCVVNLEYMLICAWEKPIQQSWHLDQILLHNTWCNYGSAGYCFYMWLLLSFLVICYNIILNKDMPRSKRI